jgi:ribosome-associated heat shock protein Hsp15
LDVACVFKTRSEAQKACRLGKVRVNGAPAKAHRDVRAGDELIVQRPLGRKQFLTVLGLADTHIPRADARLLYEDRTPKPTAAEVEIRRLERIYRAAATPATRPDRNQRRTLRRMKRGE